MSYDDDFIRGLESGLGASGAPLSKQAERDQLWGTIILGGVFALMILIQVIGKLI